MGKRISYEHLKENSFLSDFGMGESEKVSSQNGVKSDKKSSKQLYFPR